MVDLKLIEKNEVNTFTNSTSYEAYKNSLQARGFEPHLIDEVLELNKKRKQIINEAETAKAELNKRSGEVAQLKRKGEDVSDLLKELQVFSDKIKSMESEAALADEHVRQKLLYLPNYLHHTVPAGRSSEDNKIERVVGTPTKLNFTALDHITLAEKNDLIDFERACKVTGARFAFLKKGAARLERALLQMMMDVHSDQHGYEELIPPFMVNAKSLEGTGTFPKFKADVFTVKNEPEYYLIPTAEVPVTNIFAEEILDGALLPKSFVAYSPCFRSEAGSHGRDTKGLIRQHQFNKVELLKFTRPEESEAEHEKLTQHAEKILQMLELPYRVMALCSGDISFSAMKCYDLEVWLPGSGGGYREISSCSNFGDFQARRANIRFRDGKDKPRFVHTINGSGLAIGRTLIAILENYQQEDGRIKVPQALKKYMGCDTI